MIVAGAGTGKTTVLTERIAWLIREGKAKPEEILALTFTEKAAGEMEERIDRLLPYGYVDLWVSTFHAFGERVLREYGLDIGLDTNFRLLSTVDQWLLVRRNLERFDLEYYKPLGNPTKFLHALIQHFSRVKDENILQEEYLAYAKKRLKKAERGSEEKKEEAIRVHEAACAYIVYEKLLRETGHIDFGDCIVQALRLFQERPSITKIFRDRFRYILVDEFQDTNYAQYALVKHLATPKNNITVVGDDDQSIYKFRGAAVSNILEFKKDFPRSTEVVLTKNYRSRQNILDLAYRFIQQNNPHRLEAQLGSSAIGPKGKPLTKRVIKRLTSSARGRGTLLYELHDTGESEAAWVAERILALKAQDPALSWNDVAILLRGNRQADVFLHRLERAGIPYQFQAARGLYQRSEILDLIAFCKMLDNYHESPAMFRVLSMRLFNIPHRDVMLLSRYAHQKHLSLYSAAERIDGIPDVTPKGKAAIRNVCDLLRDHARVARQKSTSEVLYHFFQKTKYFDQFDRDRDQAMILNIAKFYRRIREFEEANDDQSLKAFMEETNLMLEIGEDPSPVVTEEGPEAVKVMTVHGAKGLEFSYVFLPQMVAERFPSRERRDAIPVPDDLIPEILFSGDAHLEEERRLLYVGVTRAKKGVFFSAAEDYGGARKKKPSRFLFELGFVHTAQKPPKRLQQLGMDLAPSAAVSRVRSQATYPLPDKCSYTQITAFRKCPKQYWYAHILKIPVTGNPVFSFGKSIHATLRAFFAEVKEGKKPSEQRMRELFEQNWIGDWYGSDADEARRKASGEKMLREFFQRQRKAFAVPLALEQSFTLKIGPYALRGVIDRIDPVAHEPKTVDIIDYKTGSIPKTKKAEDLDQLMLYALAAQEVFGWNPRKLLYSYVEHQKELVFDAHVSHLEQAKDRVLDTIKRIEKSDFRATADPMMCSHCDFREICEDRVV
jgi:DNA helicase-2/ATP-dependent DNA helicase PcrA